MDKMLISWGLFRTFSETTTKTGLYPQYNVDKLLKLWTTHLFSVNNRGIACEELRDFFGQFHGCGKIKAEGIGEVHKVLLRMYGFWLVLTCIVDFFMMGLDKWKAGRGLWRIPENTL